MTKSHKVKFDLSHGFPSHWGNGQLEQEIKDTFLQREHFDLVINATWGMIDCEHPLTSAISNKFEITKDLVDNHGVKSILFFNFVDPMYDASTWYHVLTHCANKIGVDNINKQI